jgi:hypothetical protein
MTDLTISVTAAAPMASPPSVSTTAPASPSSAAFTAMTPSWAPAAAPACGGTLTRRGVPLLAAATGLRDTLSRPAALGRRGFPGPASRTSPFAPHRTPVPFSAHTTDRAIRVLRSPR